MNSKNNGQPATERIIPKRDEFIGIRPTRNDAMVQPKSKSTVSFLSFAHVNLILIIIALGAIVWLFKYNQEQKLVLESAQNRIAELENRLSATGEEMDQSALALQVKVTELAKKADELWTQMDKLWASAWRRNQSEIKKLEDTTESIKGSVTKVEQSSSQALKDIKSMRSELTIFTNDLALTREVIESQKSSITDWGRNLERASQSTKLNEQTIKQMSSELSRLNQSNQRVLDRLEMLEKWRSDLLAKSTTP